ncbi:zinc finger protein 40-like [Asterias rubens]|uniref:zinc finger protein 40-like n=1 Tax=Asterias rubens TaxID=7604 RepID=UPI001455BD30|nr:zinc finger protein 40-like [Asterias rubens]
MPRQKQSKPKALKQQREEVEQLIRDGGSTDTSKQDEEALAKTSTQPAMPSTTEKGKHRATKKQHRYKSAMKVKIAKKIRNKRIVKSLQAKQSPKIPIVNDGPSSLNQNNNKEQVSEDTEFKSPPSGEDIGFDSSIFDLDIYKNKYDMIKERSLKRATKVKKDVQDKSKDTESSSRKGSESPKKSPVSPAKAPESCLQTSQTEVEVLTLQTSPKQKNLIPQYQSVKRESAETLVRFPKISADIGQRRQRSVSEGLPSKQDTVSKQQALEALLQITDVELNTMSFTPTCGDTVPGRVPTVTSSNRMVSQSAHAGFNKRSSTKISESDKGVVKYQLHSDSLEEQGLKLVYTAPSTQDSVTFSHNRTRKSSTRSNASDTAEDTTAKDAQKCCKKLGRHVCHFCGRRCTKPSVLKKHIRSHTGERPYPCLPCGFSFKTKSNLYKHCKTHAHAIKAGNTPNSDDLSKLSPVELDEDDSEETESEDEVAACDATTCQTELTDKCSHTTSQVQVGSKPRSETEQMTSLTDSNTNQFNIPMMQVHRSHAAVPDIPRHQADSQSSMETMLRHSNSLVPTPNSVLPTANIKKEMPLLSTLIPDQISKASHNSFASVAEPSQQDFQGVSGSRPDEEVVMSASGASSSQLLKTLLPGELAGFRIDMETRRAIPVLNPQHGTPGATPASQPNEASTTTSGKFIPITGFNIVKSGGQYHVQIPVQGIPEDSLTMALEGEAGNPSVGDTSNGSSQNKGVSKESLQERIQLLISQNRAIVDNADLESVKPRRTSVSRRDSENNSPRMDFAMDPLHINEKKTTDARSVPSSIYSEYTTLNSPTHHKRDSSSEPQYQSRFTHSPLADYPLPGEGNLLEKVLKSQQQNPRHPDVQTAKLDTLVHSSGNLGDNSNPIKDLLMKDRPHRLAQIAQQSPVHVSGEFKVEPGSPMMKFFQGTSWPVPQGGDSAMTQLRGSLQQQKIWPQMQNQRQPISFPTTEDVNVSQRISELRGHRRKYKSESEALGGHLPMGPSSPKRRARKIKDIPTAVSPLATSNVKHPVTNLASSLTPADVQKGLDKHVAASPHGSHYASFPGHVTSQPSPSHPLTATTSSLTSMPSHSISGQSHLTLVPGHMMTLQSRMSTGHSHMTSVSSPSMPRHMSTVPSRMTSLPSNTTSLPSPMMSNTSQMMGIPSHMTSLPSHMTSKQRSVTSVPSHMASNQTNHYSSPLPSVAGILTSDACNLSPYSMLQNQIPGQSTSVNQQSGGSVSSVYIPPSTSEVSVIQHTRTQSKGEPTNIELKLEVNQPREKQFAGFPWPYKYPISTRSPGAASPASQGLHLLAVASKKPNLSPHLSSLAGNRKRSFSMTEGFVDPERHTERVKSPWPKEDPTKSLKGKATPDSDNAAPIAMQLLAAVAHSSSYAPRLSPRDMENRSHLSETEQVSHFLPVSSSKGGSVHRGGSPRYSESPLKQESQMPPTITSPNIISQQREMASPEPKKMKLDRNTRSPRSPRNDGSKQNSTTIPSVPASRRHLTLDLKSPLTSRVKSPGGTDSPKPLLQIDPKSLLTPEALSIAESVMKLASPMKANTPSTPVESARELGRLMAHAFHNAGGKVESLITSTQGTMMIGPIATPTPGSKSGSTQYFIIPSPSSTQPPTGFPGPQSMFSPSTPSAASSALVSPLRSPMASFQPPGEQPTLSTSLSPRYKRVQPQKHNSQNKYEKYNLSLVKTNSALKQRIKLPPLSRSTARNPKVTQTTFCCVKRPQPMFVQQGPNRKVSMYSNWRPSGDFSHPLGISWKAHLGLYDSGRNKKPRFYYVTTSISPPQCGIVTDSAGWKPESAIKKSESQTLVEAQQKQEMDSGSNRPFDAGSSLEKATIDSNLLKVKDKKPKDGSDHEPSRIQIFAGGYKSNEDYVYVRGRGRGKYVCEECGIRCKKPSMLKKHIRTHTDMRPYQCHICNFAFKTKGNLTKHMKSKAHSKKCIKNGLSPMDESCMEHQFSDADDEDTDSADGDTSDEDDEDDEDDDISETHSESAVPINITVPPRERYSSVPNIQEMREHSDSQGRPLVWHQCHPEDMKKVHSDNQDRPRRDSTGSIPSTVSSASKENVDEKQPVKLSRSEVVGKLSRHLTNRHQLSLEKAQKAQTASFGKSEDTKVQESSFRFDMSQLPLLYPGTLISQPAQHPRPVQTPPDPPVLDKYGHIVLTKSPSTASQYRLSTTVQEDLSFKAKTGSSSDRVIETLPSPRPLSQPVSSFDNILSARQLYEKSNSAAMTSVHTKFSEKASSSPSTSEMQSRIEHSTNPTQTLNNFSEISSHFPFVTPSQGKSSNKPQEAVGVKPMHTMQNKHSPIFPHHAVSSDLQIAPGGNPAFPSSFMPYPHQQRTIAPHGLPTIQEITRPSDTSSLNLGRPLHIQSPTQQMKSQTSPRGHPSAALAHQSISSFEPVKHSTLPMYVEAISDDEDEHCQKKRPVAAEKRQGFMVSGSINNTGNRPQSFPSWMPESVTFTCSAIKQLLLARPSLNPSQQDSTKAQFVSPFLPPSLASPKLPIANQGSSFSSSLPMHPPLVSPMLPSKMMQLPPTILSQVRTPTVQSTTTFPPQDEKRTSPGPFVPPVSQSKSQHNWVSHQPQYESSPSGDSIIGEAPEELFSPVHVGNHKCSSCNKIFMKPSQLRIHMRVHLEENSFSCPECVQSFPTRIMLAKHERSQEHLSKVDAVELPSSADDTDPRPFKCKECQIAFRIPGHLAKHLRSRGHRMTLEREGKLPLPKEDLTGHDALSDLDQGDLIIDDSHHPLSPTGSSDKTDSASESGDLYQMEDINATAQSM